MQKKSGRCIGKTFCAGRPHTPERPIGRGSLRAPAASAARGILRALEWHTPAWVVCLEIRILYNTMSRAFGIPEKKISLWSAEALLRGGYAGRITEGCGNCRAFFVDNA